VDGHPMVMICYDDVLETWSLPWLAIRSLEIPDVPHFVNKKGATFPF